MDHLFWVIPEKLAGRPGPQKYRWDLASLREEGVGAVLSVNNGALCHREEFEAQGIQYACVPLSSNEPPLPGDDAICMAALPKAYDFVVGQMAEGRAVLVHCTAGKDRTGLFLCYYLVRNAGSTPKDAIHSVRQVRPTALSALGWEEFAGQLLTKIANGRIEDDQ